MSGPRHIFLILLVISLTSCTSKFHLTPIVPSSTVLTPELTFTATTQPPIPTASSIPISAKTHALTTLLSPVLTTTITSKPTSTQTQTLTTIMMPFLTTTPIPSLPLSENSLFRLQSQVGGGVAGVAQVDNIAYVGIGPRLATIDVSKPSNPHLLAQSDVLPGKVSGVILISPLPHLILVVSAGIYLVILTSSSEESLHVVGELTLPGAITAMVLNHSNDRLYLGGSIYQSYDPNSGDVTSGFVGIVDISGPNEPKLLDKMELNDSLLSLAMGKSFMYAGLTQNGSARGIIGIPISSSERLGKPILVIPASDDYNSAYAMQVLGDRLYIGTYQAMIVYNISNPSAPIEKWRISEDKLTSSSHPIYSVSGFVLHENRVDAAGLVCSEACYFPLGLTTFTPSELITGTPDTTTASMVAESQNRLFLANDGLEIYSYNQARNLVKLGAYYPDLAVISYHVAVGDYLYTVDEASQGETPQYLHVLRIRDLAVVGKIFLDVPKSYSFIPNWCSGMTTDGSRLYLYGHLGIWIFDISNPVKPSLLGRSSSLISDMGTGGAAASLGIRHLLFLNGLDSGILTAYDASDVNQINTLSFTLFNDRNDASQISMMVWNGNNLYALSQQSAQQSTFYVFKLENDELKMQSKTMFDGYINDMAAKNDLVALTGSQGLNIISVVDVAHPLIITQIPLKGSKAVVAFQDNHLIVVVGGTNSVLLAYDVSDPIHPQLLTANDLPVIDTISVTGKYIVLSGTLSGIEVLR